MGSKIQLVALDLVALYHRRNVVLNLILALG